jgi:hypothetical protein
VTDQSRMEHWIGKDIDYAQLWEDFNHSDGNAYVNKFLSMEPALLKIEFELPSVNQPLFHHEAIYKSFKGLYHDFKKFCLNTSEYEASKPIFLYGIERGSADWLFQLDPNMIFNFVSLLLSGFSYYRDSKNNKKILEELEAIKHQITIPEEKTDAFIKQLNSKIIFENLDKFNPKKITVRKKHFSDRGTLLTDEEITIYFDTTNYSKK